MSYLMDCGPWSAGVNEIDGRVFVQSDDFTHDVRLYVNGDFGSTEQRILYANEIALRLNETDRLREALRMIADPNAFIHSESCAALVRKYEEIALVALGAWLQRVVLTVDDDVEVKGAAK